MEFIDLDEAWADLRRQGVVKVVDSPKELRLELDGDAAVVMDIATEDHPEVGDLPKSIRRVPRGVVANFVEAIVHKMHLQQTYAIQTNALALADQRVNASGILLQAGRAQIRDQLEAQTAQVQAQNAVTQVLVDYLAARLKFLVDVGALRTEGERWWLREQALPGATTPPLQRKPDASAAAVAPPEKIFGN